MIGNAAPIINGTTDLPDGTKLSIMIPKPWLPDAQQRLARGLSACADNICGGASTGPDHRLGAIVDVKAGHFTAGPFSFEGKSFPPGTYSVQIMGGPAAHGKDIYKGVLYAAEIEVTSALGGAVGPPSDQAVDATPPTPAATSLNCTAATKPAERLVCADARLSELDVQISGMYRAAQSIAADPRTVVLDQRQWLGQRDACMSTACLERLYQQRKAELARWVGPE